MLRPGHATRWFLGQNDDGINETLGDLKPENAEVRSGLRAELGHDRRGLYAFCGTAIVSLVALLAKGVLY